MRSVERGGRLDELGRDQLGGEQLRRLPMLAQAVIIWSRLAGVITEWSEIERDQHQPWRNGLSKPK